MTSSRWLSTFFALLLFAAAVLAALMAYSVEMARNASFPEENGDPSLVVQEKAFLSHNRSCDILVYGDSTASIGVDPRVLTAELGLSACNIASTRPIVDDLGELPLDVFLQHNPRPKFIVLQFGPEVFYRGSSWTHNGSFATMVMLSRDVPRKDAVLTMLRHPSESVQFMIVMMQQKLTAPKRTEYQRKQFTQIVELFESSGGLLTLGLPPNRLAPHQRSNCTVHETPSGFSNSARNIRLTEPRLSFAPHRFPAAIPSWHSFNMISLPMSTAMSSLYQSTSSSPAIVTSLLRERKSQPRNSHA